MNLIEEQGPVDLGHLEKISDQLLSKIAIMGVTQVSDKWQITFNGFERKIFIFCAQGSATCRAQLMNGLNDELDLKLHSRDALFLPNKIGKVSIESPAGDPESSSQSPGPTQLIYGFVSEPSYYHDEASRHPAPIPLYYRSSPGVTKNHIGTLIEIVFDASKTKEPIRSMTIERAVYLLSIYVLRSLLEEHPVETGKWLAELSHPVLEHAITVIGSGDVGTQSLESVAGSIGVHPNVLDRAFEKFANVPLDEYIRLVDHYRQQSWH